MKKGGFLGIILATILMNSCAPLRMVTAVNNGNIRDYQYVFISPTETITSRSSSNSGSMVTKSVNPRDVIAGILSKEGFIIVPELTPQLADRTLIVNYGESGRRTRLLGSAIEVTLQFISAKSHALICSATAEGQQGNTEADAIRQAITRSLSAMLENSAD